MSPQDVALMQQAIELAQNGQKQEAYQRFCDLYKHGDAEDITLLYWIAFTTPSQQEAKRAVGDIARIAPEHSSLPALYAYIERKWPEQKQEPHPPQVLELECPYCKAKAPPFVRSKVSAAGWVFFVVVLILFFPLCWIGLFIRDDYYVCARCGMVLSRTY